MTLIRKNTNKKKNLAYVVLLIGVIAAGAVSTSAMRSSYAQNSSNTTSFDQYIVSQEPSLGPLVQKALSPTGNASLPQDLADIVSTGEQLSSKEFTAANNAQNASKPVLELRYANSAVDLDKHLINLVTQYEWDIKQPDQAKMAEQVSDLSGIIQNIQWKEVRTFEISKAVAKYNLTMPDGMNVANTAVSNAQQDVQSIYAAENNGTDYKSINQLLNHASRQLQIGEKEIRESSRAVDLKIDLAKGETTIDKLLKRLTTTADFLDQKAENQQNTQASSEISAARADLNQAQTAEANGDNASALVEIRDAIIHLAAAASLMT